MKLIFVLGLSFFAGVACAEVTTLHLPEKASLTFESPKMSKLKEMTQDGRYQYAASSAGESDPRFNLSIYVEAIDCRYGKSVSQVARCFVEGLDSIPGVIKEADSPSCERQRCDVFYVLSRKVGERTIRQLHLNSLFVYGGRWVDVHLTVLNPVAEDAQRLAKFAATLQLAE